MIGNYHKTPSGWLRLITLRVCTLNWLEVNTVKLRGGPLSKPERRVFLTNCRWL